MTDEQERAGTLYAVYEVVEPGGTDRRGEVLRRVTTIEAASSDDADRRFRAVVEAQGLPTEAADGSVEFFYRCIALRAVEPEYGAAVQTTVGRRTRGG